MRIVDLFCGCGGFSLGAHYAGLSPVIAFDVDSILTSSFENNFPQTRRVLADISTVSGSDIIREISGPVDGIFGGPPCQAFSTIGRRDVADPRRNLLVHFFRIVAEAKPAFFVMENVRGLAFGETRKVLDAALELVPSFYKIVGPVTLNAAEFGAATDRSRIFVIGYDPGRIDEIGSDEINLVKSRPTTVRSAIADLETAAEIGTFGEFDLWKIKKVGRPSHYASQMMATDRTFTGHRLTVHTPEVLKRFRLLKPGQTDGIGRFPRLKWDGQCPTLRAGTGSERGSYQSVRPVHPNKHRVITVREAARLQGFPDMFLFHPSSWHSFRMIGNSVSPILAKAIFSLIGKKMGVLNALTA